MAKSTTRGAARAKGGTQTEAPAPRGRPAKNLKAVTLVLTPEQHEALQDAVSRARLERLPNVGEGASYIVRELVEAWMKRGAKWPG